MPRGARSPRASNPRDRIRRTRCADAGRRSARPRSHRPDHRPRSGSSPRTNRRASKPSRAAASPASRSRASSATRNSGDCRCSSRPRRWCRGPIPRPWSKLALELLRADEPRSPACASPISAPAPARSCWRCCRELPDAQRHRHRHQRRRAANRREPMPRALGLADRAAFIACDYAIGADAARSI